MAKVDNKLYDEKSIESLSPLEFTRLRPGVYCGDTAYSTQLLVEIVSNAVDEFRLGHGNQIDVTIEGDVVTVRDYGQGFIVNSVREDGKTILEAAFSVLNTSGKYREDGTYEGTSLGSFGIGSKITTFLSHWLQVKTFRDGKYEHIWFKEGVFENRKVGNATDEQTGTMVSWEPSEEFFTDIHVEIKKITDLFIVITCLCPGLTINFNDNGKLTKFFSEHGLNDLTDSAVKDNELIDKRFNMNFAEGKNKMDMILTYTSNYSCTLVPYVNTGLTERGPHITQVKTILTREFNKFFREKKWLKDKDENLTGDDIQEGMYIVFNITAPNVSYDAQVKSTVTKIDMAPFTSAIVEQLQFWMATNEKDVKIIADKVDKVDGKQLSSEDFTTELKAKLENLIVNEDILDVYDGLCIVDGNGYKALEIDAHGNIRMNRNTNGALSGKSLYTLCDSLGTEGHWQKKLCDITGMVLTIISMLIKFIH